MILFGVVTTLALVAARPHSSEGPCGTSGVVSWMNCTVFGYPYNATDSPVPECGTFDVPTDYKNCSAGVITLAVARRNATALPRMGSIFTNPGGPGDSGLDYVFDYGVQLMEMSGGHYDIVSWDPRGVASTSLLIDCFATTEEHDMFIPNNSIIAHGGAEAYGNFTNANHTDPDELAFWALEKSINSRVQNIAKHCLHVNGASLTHVGTVATARDIVSLSDAIEGLSKPVNFWGVSYGSFLGQILVHLFPERVGRVIVDGVVNPILWAQQPQYLITGFQLQDADSAFDEFTKSCAAAGELCAIATSNSTQESVKAWLQGVLDWAFQTYDPKNSSTLSSGVIRWVLFQAQYIATYASAPQYLIARETTRGLAGHYIVPPKESTSRRAHERSLRKRSRDADTYDMALEAIACSDSALAPNTTTVDVFNEVIYTASNVTQMFGPLLSFSDYCHKWPVRAVERYSGPWNTTLANPILVIGNKGDPATPLAAAKLVADMLGNSAVLLQRDGYGHSSLAEPSTCTNQILAAFFNNGTFPTAGTICATNRNYFGTNTTSNDSLASTIVSAVPTSSANLIRKNPRAP